MFRLFLVLVLLSGSMGWGLLKAFAQNQMSARDLLRREKEAHTSGEYRSLSEYFRREEVRYRGEADKEQQEIKSLQRSTAIWPSKYPTRMDAAMHLYQFYSLKAEQMKDLAMKYESKGHEAADASKLEFVKPAPKN